MLGRRPNLLIINKTQYNMKLEYVKPDLEELELVIEGSYLATATTQKPGIDPEEPEIPIDPGDEGDDDIA